MIYFARLHIATEDASYGGVELNLQVLSDGRIGSELTAQHSLVREGLLNFHLQLVAYVGICGVTLE